MGRSLAGCDEVLSFATLPTLPVSRSSTNCFHGRQPLGQRKPHSRTIGPVMNSDQQCPLVSSTRRADLGPRNLIAPALYSLRTFTPPSAMVCWV